MKLLSVDSLAEAREKLLSITGELPCHCVTVSLDKALEQVLAEDLTAPFMIPDFRRSTVDGYAVIASDTWGASDSSPVFLEVIGEVEMGDSAQLRLQPGECVYVPTGGMLPEGAQSMVMIEYCETFKQNHIAVYQSTATGANIIEIGEDLEAGQLLLPKSTCIHPGHIAVLAAAGVKEISVFCPLSLTIISTGDELVIPGEPKHAGQVYDINTSGLQALAIKHGLVVRNTYVLKDDEAALLEAVAGGMQQSDIVVVSGGSSQGKKDITHKIIDQVAVPGVFTHGLALKPGKPTILGYDQGSKTILTGLPGHPVAAMLVFELLIAWYVRYLQGVVEEFTIPAVMKTNLASAPGKTTCQLVTLVKTKNDYVANPVFGKSGLISTLSGAHGYVEINRNKEGIKAGEQVEVHLL